MIAKWAKWVMLSLAVSVYGDVPLMDKEDLRVIWDATNPDSFPRRFRSTNQSRLTYSVVEGLEDLRISGSGQFSASGLDMLLSAIPTSEVIVIDLRQECHGFINGLPVSWLKGINNWLNVGRTVGEIERDEFQKLNQASEAGVITVQENKESNREITVSVNEIATEKSIVEAHGIRHVRIPVTDNHRATSQAVDQFIGLVLELPSSSWIHFHCKAGGGRTTSFMVMYDIIRNGDHLTLEQILQRQVEMGGTDLSHIPQPWERKHKPALERWAFIQAFYTYRNETQLQESFSLWEKRQYAPQGPQG